MFGKRKNKLLAQYDNETQIPVIRCSICTGEQVAGFKDKKTGHFKDIMLIKDGKDLDKFLKMYGLDSVEKEY